MMIGAIRSSRILPGTKKRDLIRKQENKCSKCGTTILQRDEVLSKRVKRMDSMLPQRGRTSPAYLFCLG